MNKSPNRTLSIGVVDDHPFVAKGLAAALSLKPGVELLWDATDADRAVELLDSQPVDVVVVDLKMEEANSGLKVLRVVEEKYESTSAVVFTAHAPRRLVREAAVLGAKGYFTKDVDIEEFVDALLEIADGKASTAKFSGALSELAKPNPYLDISNRERDVLLLVSKGKSNVEVAEELGLKVGTVKTHLESIYKKLSVNNRTDALRAALSEGYFSLEELV
ncbi:response regulator [Pelagicoccus albus]|uniref:Response regulator transcription factor n=1 Tax=Pelagicoccus albus TaxID=415222 RepID=A0A7X1B6V5_9BACT|nr:response regulator transcription factor [Pelagicoccus albus]MBC2605473.1 response regulator transcription factor [Pelagicoccus albus]